MDEQVNIPALGIVCHSIRISKVRASQALGVSQDRARGFGQGQFELEKCLEMYYDARLYQTVPQTDTGG